MQCCCQRALKHLTRVGKEEGGVIMRDDRARVDNDMALGLEEVQELLADTFSWPLHALCNRATIDKSAKAL